MMIANYMKGDFIKGYDSRTNRYLVQLGKGGLLIIDADELLAKVEDDVLFIAKSGGLIEPLRATKRNNSDYDGINRLIRCAKVIRDRSQPFRIPNLSVTNMQVSSGYGNQSFDAGNEFQCTE